jgi:hypothetical protein
MFISLQQIPLESRGLCEALGKMVCSDCERAPGGLPRTPVHDLITADGPRPWKTHP